MTMKKMVTLSIAALMSTVTLGLATPAAAQNGYYDQGGYSSYYSGYDRDDRRYDRYDRRDYRRDRRDYRRDRRHYRSEEHTSELQSLMRLSYAVFCLKKKNSNHRIISTPLSDQRITLTSR